MIKYKIIFSILFVALLSFGYKARAQADTATQKLETAKIAFISTKIMLTPEQAKVFWPVYEQYEAKRKQIRKQIRQLRVDYRQTQGSDKQARQSLKILFELRQQELNIEKLYCDKFLEIIQPAQVVRLYKAQKDFTKMLIRRLGQQD